MSNLKLCLLYPACYSNEGLLYLLLKEDVRLKLVSPVQWPVRTVSSHAIALESSSDGKYFM